MKSNLKFIFQTAFLFIGTIVGAGLASGQEITQFFSTYGKYSFYGIAICFFMYIYFNYIIINLSYKFKLKSYNDLIMLVCPNYLGKFTNLATTFFLFSSSALILAGSGALIEQFFHISKWYGIITMVFLSLITLLKDTKGIITINSIIVPSLIIVILTIFLMYKFFCFNTMGNYNTCAYFKKNGNFIISSLLYGGFNILCCSGVLIPYVNETRKKKETFKGICLGSLILTILCIMINIMLILNMPYIFNYEIPLLYIANRFGKIIEGILLCIIFLEMFSTEVSDIYSISKNISSTFNIPYKLSIILILFLNIPICQIGFKNLITFLYPAFGIIGFIFLINCSIFYYKNL